jgi:hypothetical protein
MAFGLPNGDWSDDFPIGNNDNKPKYLNCLQYGKQFKNDIHDGNLHSYVKKDGKIYEDSICLNCWNKG